MDVHLKPKWMSIWTPNEWLNFHLLNFVTLSHLEVEIDPGRLDCIDKHSEGSFHRINKNNTEDPFTQELHQLLDTNILNADSLLKNLTGRGLVSLDMNAFQSGIH